MCFENEIAGHKASVILPCWLKLATLYFCKMLLIDQKDVITMYSHLKTTVLLTIALLFVAGYTPSYANPANDHNKQGEQINQVIRDEVDALLSEPGDINRKSPKNDLSPLMAAALLAPERIPEMIAAGADVNVASAGSGGLTALHLLMIRGYHYRNLWPEYRYEPYNDSHELAAFEALLKAGADPNAVNKHGSTPAHLVTTLAFTLSDENSSLDKKVERMTLLIKYGADLSLKDNSNNTIYDRLPTGRQLSSNWLNFNRFMYDVQEEGLETALFNYHHREEESQAQARREKEAAEAERQRKRQVAREIARQKRELITRSFNENPDLRAALTSLKESARPCRTLDRINTEVYGFGCGTIVNGSNFHPQSCYDYQEKLQSVVRQQRDKVCAPYKNQRKQLADLFGENAQLADSIIANQIIDAPDVTSLKNHYSAEISRMRKIRDSAARSQKAVEDQAFQQGMYNLAQYAQSSIGSKTAADQIIEKSVADTQRTLYAIDSAQKMAKINADLEAINKQLRNIKTTSSPPSAASSTTSYQSRSNQPASTQPVVTKKECVAQAESKGPMPNVPQSYCQYVFSDNTDTVKINWGDYSNQFNEESGSLQQAQKNIGTPLLKKARQVCEGRGYTRVHHPETYQFNQVASQVTDCKENNRLGSTFHLCIGTASFICAR